MEVGSVCSLLACPYLAGKSIPSPASEPTLGFQCILKTSWDIQPPGLNNYWTSGLSVHCWISLTEACMSLFFFFWEFILLSAVCYFRELYYSSQRPVPWGLVPGPHCYWEVTGLLVVRASGREFSRKGYGTLFVFAPFLNTLFWHRLKGIRPSVTR